MTPILVLYKEGQKLTISTAILPKLKYMTSQRQNPETWQHFMKCSKWRRNFYNLKREVNF